MGRVSNSHPAHAVTVTKNTTGMSAIAAFACIITCRLTCRPARRTSPRGIVKPASKPEHRQRRERGEERGMKARGKIAFAKIL